MLTGKFVIVDSDDHYRTGSIIEQVAPDLYLVQFDNMMGKSLRMPMELASTAQMAGEIGLATWMLFDSAEDRKQYLDWLDSPAEPKIVKLVKK